MKKFFLAMVCAAMMTACSSPIDKLESFVEDTEKECEEFTAEDWEDNAQEFEELVANLEENKEDYTSEDMEKIGKLTARYMKVKMKQGGKMLKGVGSFMKGMMDKD